MKLWIGFNEQGLPSVVEFGKQMFKSYSYAK